MALGLQSGQGQPNQRQSEQSPDARRARADDEPGQGQRGQGGEPLSKMIRNNASSERRRDGER
jgi:hypothetical protein